MLGELVNYTLAYPTENRRKTIGIYTLDLKESGSAVR